MFGLAVAAALIGGCGCSPRDDAVKPEYKKALVDANSLATKVDGDFDKLAPGEQKVILDMTHGDREQAKRLCYLMAHPPNQGMVRGQRPNGAPPVPQTGP